MLHAGAFLLGFFILAGGAICFGIIAALRSPQGRRFVAFQAALLIGAYLLGRVVIAVTGLRP